MSCDTSNYYQLALTAQPQPFYNAATAASSSIGLLDKQQETNSHTYKDSAAILDLSLPSTTLPLDSSWQSDPPSLYSSTKQCYTKTHTHYQASTTTIRSTEITENPTLEIPKVSTLIGKNYEAFLQQQASGEPLKLHALWDSIYPAEESENGIAIPSYLSQPSMNKATVVSPVPTTDIPSKSDVSLREMLNFDDLDMSDISNILTIPMGTTKPARLEIDGKLDSTKPSTLQGQPESRTNPLELPEKQLNANSNLPSAQPYPVDTQSKYPDTFLNQRTSLPKQPGILPNLSSFLRDIDYL